MAYEFRLPDIGEGLHEAEILEWYVNEGQVIQADDAIAEVQTDKAAVELTSPVGGRVLTRCGPAGSAVKVGELVIALETSAGGIAPASPSPAPNRVLASPAVRKLARDAGVDLHDVVPTGVNGRLTRADVRQAAVQSQQDEGVSSGDGQLKSAPASSIPASAAGAESGRSGAGGSRADRTGTGRSGAGGSRADRTGTESTGTGRSTGAADETVREPIRGLRKRIYENMTKSMYTAPQVTGMDDLDATGLVHLRKRLLPFADARGIKLTYLPVIVKAVSHVLEEYPIFNASVDDEQMELVYKKGIHIGIATATPEGLLVPVIRDADTKSVFAIAQELQDLTERGRAQQLKMEELRGSTFTITSTGARGGWFATPIVNYPEVAILGVHSIVKKAVVLPDDRIVPQQRMGFSLTFDHRVIDGEPAGQFMYRLKEYLENPEAMLAL